MGLVIRSSAIHAAGCYTTTAIRKGARVAEYTGHIMTKDEADKRYEDSPVTYLFGLGDGAQVIDGHSAAMFVNHSCAPNCETEEIGGHVWIMAIRNIAAGEEITYDYCLYDGGNDEAICNCGARKCRGTMYSDEEVKSRRAKARKAAQRRNNRSSVNARKRQKP
ncbi:MAG TPA: SET domain-containing protein-lysine N-methyltransferase [Terracidiphilus sp.]|jgi:SET domain-containing protein|nr:SET domain-containing protein-lysine N-methyltransferase [Terracidiphilus sp.]